MTEYYVAKNGNDGNPGTKARPWLTIQKAADTAQPGDFVVVLEGDYLIDERVYVNNSGSDGMMVTFQTDGQVEMRGFTIKADWITVRGFEIPETTPSEVGWEDGHGVFVHGDHCRIEDNYIHFTTWPGIMLYALEGMANPSSYCIVKNNRIHRCQGAGILVNGRNHLIEYNEVWETIQKHPHWTEWPGWVDADGMHFHGSGHVFRGNYIHDISYDQPENDDPHIDAFQTRYAPGELEKATNILFEKNVVDLTSHLIGEGVAAIFMLESASDILIINNKFRSGGGLNTGGGNNSDLKILNNVWANDLLIPLSLYPCGIGLENCPNAVVQNNILYDQPAHTISAIGNVAGHEIDYNLAYRSDSQPSWKYKVDYTDVEPPPPHHRWDVDPLFVDPVNLDFRIHGGSPAKDMGIVLSEVTDDFKGIERPQGSASDIGTFEYEKLPAQGVEEINITNWQETGTNVNIPQYSFDLEIKWTDQFGAKREHSGTYLYPNDISEMPNKARRRFAEEMIVATARVELGIDEWERSE